MSRIGIKHTIFVFIFIALTTRSCQGQNDTIREISKNGIKIKRSIIDHYGPPPFAPFGAAPPPFGFLPPYAPPAFASAFPAVFPPFPPAFPPPFPPPFGGFPPPLGPPLPLAPPPVLPSPFPAPFPLPFYPPAPPAPFGYGFPYPVAPPAVPIPLPPPAPPPPPPPPPTPIILPAHTAATLSVASLLHALIAKKFYPPVVPFPVPKPIPFPVTVKIPVPVPVPVERPEHVTILRPSSHYEEPVNHGDTYHEMENEWNSVPPEIIRQSE